jgi:hypothetical protein
MSRPAGNVTHPGGGCPNLWRMLSIQEDGCLDLRGMLLIQEEGCHDLWVWWLNQEEGCRNLRIWSSYQEVRCSDLQCGPPSHCDGYASHRCSTAVMVRSFAQVLAQSVSECLFIGVSLMAQVFRSDSYQRRITHSDSLRMSCKISGVRPRCCALWLICRMSCSSGSVVCTASSKRRLRSASSFRRSSSVAVLKACAARVSTRMVIVSVVIGYAPLFSFL